jgi:hypothetical protein
VDAETPNGVEDFEDVCGYKPEEEDDADADAARFNLPKGVGADVDIGGYAPAEGVADFLPELPDLESNESLTGFGAVVDIGGYDPDDVGLLDAELDPPNGFGAADDMGGYPLTLPLEPSLLAFELEGTFETDPNGVGAFEDMGGNALAFVTALATFSFLFDSPSFLVVVLVSSLSGFPGTDGVFSLLFVDTSPCASTLLSLTDVADGTDTPPKLNPFPASLVPTDDAPNDETPNDGAFPLPNTLPLAALDEAPLAPPNENPVELPPPKVNPPLPILD